MNNLQKHLATLDIEAVPELRYHEEFLKTEPEGSGQKRLYKYKGTDRYQWFVSKAYEWFPVGDLLMKNNDTENFKVLTIETI